MKAKDITTPGDYEVRVWGNRERRTIVDIEKRGHMVEDDHSGYLVTSLFAIDTKGAAHRPRSVIKPWET